nr:exosortase V [Sphingomonas mesophila]
MLLGFAALALPTFFDLANIVWSTEDGAHGPIILASGLWLLARQSPELAKAAQSPPLWLAIGALGSALLVYLFGRLVGVIGIETGGLMLSVVALVFAFGGTPALRAAWFPLFYLAFLVPLPDTVVALLTQPMKLGISNAATQLLQAVGYPIANTGVTLQVGPYELLVAQACSGLNTVISLSAVGLLYIYLLHRTDWRYAMLLLLFVLPAAILANFVRVLLLILLTYHAGDGVAQGFLHNAAGIFTFAIALGTVFVIDHLLAPVRARWARR